MWLAVKKKKKHQSFLCFITFYVQIKMWTWAGAPPANPICLLTSEGGSRGSDMVKDDIVNSPCQWGWWTGSATVRVCVCVCEFEIEGKRARVNATQAAACIMPGAERTISVKSVRVRVWVSVYLGMAGLWRNCGTKHLHKLIIYFMHSSVGKYSPLRKLDKDAAGNLAIITCEKRQRGSSRSALSVYLELYCCSDPHADAHTSCLFQFLFLVMSPNDSWPFTAWDARDELERWWGGEGGGGPVVTPYRGCQPSFSHFKAA